MLKIALIAFLALPSIACANSLTGIYSHNYTAKKNEPVWSIKAKNNAFTLTTHGENGQSRLQTLTDSEIREFWEKMGWEEEFAKGVECIGNAGDIFCKVPAKTKNGISWLRENKSDYFHFDKIGGLMEIKKASK
ncbi:MAG TPA: hypothetical protein VFF03_02010 [Rhodocyclaceae bacterium]|nr:hypothetical protein [Rhodocyclaceae bacterium]